MRVLPENRREVPVAEKLARLRLRGGVVPPLSPMSA
jgi:hypothetical protein